MPAPVVTSGSLTLDEGVAGDFVLEATNIPTGWSISGEPSGVTLEQDPYDEGLPRYAWVAVSGAVAPGVYSITISATNGSGTGNGTLELTVNAASGSPTISSISPSTGGSTASVSVTITGTNFSGSATVTVGGSQCSNVSIVSSTQITCTVPSGAVGAQDVVVTVTGGSATLVGGFTRTLEAPTVTSRTASGTAGASGTAQMSASPFPTSWSLPGSPPSGVSINSVGLVAWTSALAIGVYSITVRGTNATGNGDGTLTLTITSNKGSAGPKTSLGSNSFGGNRFGFGG